MDSLFGRLGRGAGIAVRAGVLSVAAFASVTYAAFLWDTKAGLVAVGASLFTLDWLREKSAPRR